MTYWNYIYVCLQSDDLNVEYQSCLLSCLVIKDEEVEAEEEVLWMDCYNDRNCKSANIVYWFECNLHKPRMCRHPSAGHGIIINANDIR
jgi:hypothetical protein